MQFCSLASGSNGNSYYIGEGGSRILLDLGISAKQAETSLRQIDVDPACIQAILVTHEHSDHIRGIGVWARRYRIPVLGSEGTLMAMDRMSSLGKLPPELLYPIRAGKRYNLGALSIEPFSPFHDAADPLGYSVSAGGKKVTVMTDTGMISPQMEERLKCSDLAVLESNYDPQMLMYGPYPPILKKRIRSNVGHLSNIDCGQILSRVFAENPGLFVLLGHLSEENNRPDLALQTVCDLARNTLESADRQITLTVRGARTDVFTV